MFASDCEGNSLLKSPATTQSANPGLQTPLSEVWNPGFAVRAPQGLPPGIQRCVTRLIGLNMKGQIWQTSS